MKEGKEQVVISLRVSDEMNEGIGKRCIVVRMMMVMSRMKRGERRKGRKGR